jgi:SAM-dependent methyltransferase
MERTPEPELMDDAEQVAAYLAADFSVPDEAFAAACLDWLASCGVARPEKVLDLGCGPGNIALRLAERLPDAVITGLDGAPAMLDAARARTPASARVRWLQATLPAVPLAEATFDCVVSNSLLHHLHDPSVLWASLRRLGRPGAPYIIGDLRRPATPAEALALCDLHAGPAPPVLRRDFLASLHAAFEPGEVEAQLAEAGLHDARVIVTSDRHLRVLGRVP